MKTQLQSIKIELAECRKAWAENPDAKFAWCCHHEFLIELLTEPAKNRIRYILSSKPKNEQAARFRNFRPVRIACAEYEKTAVEFEKVWTEWNKVSAELNKSCAEHDKAWTEYYKARTEYNNASAEYDRIRAEHKSELELLHNQDWADNTWNGNTVFG